MSKRMFIDARQPEETRVVIASAQDSRMLEYDYENSNRKIYKGNIYLAKIVRIEPSLQAAFVEYGQDRHGFLPFSDIHPDYYKLPTSEKSKTEESAEDKVDTKQTVFEETASGDVPKQDNKTSTVPEPEALITAEEDPENISSFRRDRLYRQYKIQEVIKKGQVLLAQVAREQRGEKGAALTTYLTLAGRYCVLMPNAGKAGGVSRKIQDNGDRQRLKRILDGIEVPDGMGLIIRTAGMDRTKAEIRKDLDYLLKIWQKIRDLTLASVAPQLIHTEGTILQRTIRDLYTKDIQEILVEGAEAYKITKSYMRILMPSHARKVVHYTDTKVPLFHNYNLEEQLDSIQESKVQLRSGGYLVIDTTEALVAVDVNSGKSTKERHIDETALKTNLEAAEEVARQMRLRDLAGLVVIDFIDMDEDEHKEQVEQKLKECLQNDRARVQVGKISDFGLLEMSRQRLRPSLVETTKLPCEHCNGEGYVKDTVSLALQAFRILESNIIQSKEGDVFTLTLPVASAFVLFNQKRKQITELEGGYNVTIDIRLDENLLGAEYKLIQNNREIKSFNRLSRRQTAKTYHAVMAKANKEKPKLEPVEMYDLEDDALIESYSNNTENNNKEKSHHNRSRKFDRRGQYRNRRYQDRRNNANAPSKKAVEKKPWWKRLLKG